MSIPSSNFLASADDVLVNYAAMLMQDIVRAARDISNSRQSQQLDDVVELVFSDLDFFVPKDAKRVTVTVRISSRVPNADRKNDGSSKIVLDASIYSEREKPIFDIVVDGSLSWQKMKDNAVRYAAELYRTLENCVLELSTRNSTAHDHITWTLGTDEDDEETIHRLSEEAVEEALDRADKFSYDMGDKNFTDDQMVEFVESGPIWKKICSFSDVKTRATLMKLVYETLVEVGYV